MIIGIGQDIVDTTRIARALQRFGERFERRVFTATEQSYAHARRVPAHAYARRFAAKEACAKALGSGIGHCGVSWRDIEVAAATDGGLPELHLHGGALARLSAITPPSSRGVWHVSMSDDPPYALAMVVLEAVDA